MKRFWFPVLSLLLLLCTVPPAPPAQPDEDTVAVWLPDEDLREDMDVETPATLFVPDRELSLQETVEAYFEQQYLAYSNLVHIDITSILHGDEPMIANSVIWSEMLAMRRRLLYEHNLCYVELEQFPYAIRYIEESELLDEREEFWAWYRPAAQGEVTVHFVIEGEEGCAYPPVMAAGAQHSIRLVRVDGMWKISFHYFPGSVRKFVRSGNLAVPTEKEMLADLALEFAVTDSAGDGEGTYDGQAAAAYARQYTEHRNPEFYDVGDWIGNCANFTSQCVWAGLGRRMSGEWWASDGGGSPAWENVNHFWENITAGGALKGRVLEGIAEVREGDLLQTGPGGYRTAGPARGTFTHSMIVVDSDTLLLGQNTPAAYVYYADLVNVETRIVRPMTLD